MIICNKTNNIPEIRALKGSPLLCIDEVGGRVARIGRNSNFKVKTYESMGAIGDTKADTHFGYASSQKTCEEMLSCEMVTFKAGIQWGCQLIMTAHISAPGGVGGTAARQGRCRRGHGLHPGDGRCEPRELRGDA